MPFGFISDMGFIVGFWFSLIEMDPGADAAEDGIHICLYLGPPFLRNGGTMVFLVDPRQVEDGQSAQNLVKKVIYWTWTD